ncbi:Ig-like domain-containing protein, partial [Leucobacter sp. M11]|uniref:Ig-like domain-containing protein n=1 Tax=Leucobacter sp. M11 TaxID=2993565 RepID=UPI002D7F853F
MTGLTRSAPRGPVTSERRARLRTVVAAGLVAALGAAAAVFAAGYDAREIPREETAVWVARDAGQYARVNTVTREIDTVRQAEDPTQVVQSGADGILFTDGLSRAWPIDPAVPVDVGAASTPSGGSTSEPAEPAQTAAVSGSAPLPGAGGPPVEHTPNGTREVLSAAGTLAVRTDSGGVFLSAPGAERAAGEDAVATPLAGPPSDAAPGSAGRVDGLRPISMPDGAVPPDADAIALDEAGTLALFSRAEGSIRRYDTDRGQFRGGAEPVGAGAADVERPQLALIDGDWALLDPDAGLLWRAGVAEPRALDLSGTAQLQASGPGHDGAALIADEAGLWRVGAEGTPERLAVAEGQPAQPRSIAGQQHAAWLGPEGGTLWAAAGEAAGEARQIPLDPSVDAAARPLHPVLQSNGSRGVLLETGTGMLWTLPDGQLIPVAQWTVTDPPKEDTGAVVVEDVTEQLPPVAVPDEFGVRAGRQAILPVLLNDFDPNKKDVLTIVPESLAEGLDPADFGSAQLLPDAQALTVRVAEHATGSATLRYRITDGVHVSEPATVTLTVAPEDVNTAPEWCGVEGCQRAWPTPELAPGGTLVLPVLEGWVDPEGDPVVLTAARVTHPADPVRAVVGADGRVAVRHSDPNAPDGPVSIEVTVSDSRGAETTRELVVQISAAAALSFEGMAATVPTGEATELSPLDRVSGGSGDIELVDAVLPASAPGWSVTPRPESGRVTLVADAPGSQTVTVTVRDRVLGSELSGPVRVSAQPGGLALAVPPMRAFVRPLQDATVGVLDALPRGEARGLLVTGVSVTSGELTADVIEQHRVRVAGTTPDGGAGLIGTAEVTVADGTEHATGELTVFQVPEVTDGVVVSVPDAATVRAGSVVDLRVLENDLGPRGERLTLSPEVTGSGAPGELAFASGNTLRYLAPKQAGTYELGYRAFLDSDPERFDTARVTIRVLPAGSNGDPVPAPVTARVLPGQTTRVAVPLTGVDPDGDRVRLVSVDAPGDETISAHLGRRGDEIV